jgi:tetratricopeptide (TPR) repeat protein
MCDARLAAAHWELARLRYLRGDLDRCQSEIAEALKVNPTYTQSKKFPVIKVAPMKTLNAQCLEFKGKLADAIDAYLDLARVRGSDALYAAHIEELKKKIKLIEKARKKTPLAYDPEEVDALVSKGMEQYEDGDLTGAKASFERAIELNPASVEGLMNLCAVQESQGDLNAAQATNQKAITVCPQFDGAYYNFGYLLEKMNLPADAGMMYDKFHKISGKYPYDPQHVIKLQQDMIRQQKIEENRRTRGY